jgi:hypothetical protein
MVLRIDSNQTRFMKRNVKAICSIGQHEKEQKPKKGFIEENRADFKLVFKVDDVVYLFKCDSVQTLGMMMPILNSFPRTVFHDGDTQILLRIKSQQNFNIINVKHLGSVPIKQIPDSYLRPFQPRISPYFTGF